MATAPLGTLLRHLHHLAAGGLARQTDRQLLDDFAAGGDEAAFAALVSRHGPMVLRVCRRVLRQEQDAEDAFQATFLVLARHTASIRKREALAQWLHGVAYRTAMEARRKAARRRKHEARLRASAAPSGRGQETASQAKPTWDDIQAVLDEEIRRLPDPFRAAFVLCVLEGRTVPEAAAELGVKAGTVSSRLTRARQRLRQRLAGRGIQLSALLAALSLADTRGKAALPAALAVAAVRCGLSVAAGGTSAGHIPSRVAALAAGVTRAMFLTKAKVATAVLLAASLLAAGGVFAHQAKSARVSPAAAAAPSTPAREERPAPRTRAGAHSPDAPADTVAYSGRVLAPTGRPVAGAKVYYLFLIREDEPVPVRATSDRDGYFRFILSPTDVPPSADALGQDPRRTGSVVVKADGFAFAWRCPARQATDLAIRLARDDTPVHGRVVDLQGKPVAGVRVTVLGGATNDQGDLSGFLQGLPTRGPFYPALVKYLPNHLFSPFVGRREVGLLPSATTDADGRFRIRGFAREQLVELRLDGPTIEKKEVYVLTRARPTGSDDLLTPTLQSGEAMYGPPERVLLRWNGFTHAAAPGQVVVGTVRDAVTKAPLPGAVVESYMLAGTNLAQNTVYHTVADRRGRYRFTGLPRGRGNQIRIRPAPGQPYLPVVKEVPAEEPFVEATVDADLTRGVFVDVTARDKQSGRPVPGYVSYFVLPDPPQANPFDRPFRDAYDEMTAVRNDGTYRFVAAPRRAVLAFRADWDKYPIAREAPTVKLPSLVSAANYQAFATIDPKAGGDPVKVDFVLDAGSTVKVRVAGPDGKPLHGVLAAGLRHDWYTDAGWPRQTAEFTALGLEPGRPRLLCFAQPEKKLAGSVVVRAGQPSPVTVRLRPWATVRGRLLGADGKPVKNARLWFTEVPRSRPGRPRAPDVGLHVVERSGYKPSPDPRTDDEGRFRVEGLVPGLKYNLALVDERGALDLDHVKWLGLVFRNLVLQPGEAKDLGDVKLQPFPKE